MTYQIFGPDRSFEEPERSEPAILYCSTCGVETYFGDELTFKGESFCSDDCLSEFIESNDKNLFEE